MLGEPGMDERGVFVIPWFAVPALFSTRGVPCGAGVFVPGVANVPGVVDEPDLFDKFGVFCAFCLLLLLLEGRGFLLDEPCAFEFPWLAVPGIFVPGGVPCKPGVFLPGIPGALGVVGADGGFCAINEFPRKMPRTDDSKIAVVFLII